MKWLERLLGKAPQSAAQALADDPRWQRFNDTSFQCNCCRKSFNGISDISFTAPDVWDGEPTQLDNCAFQPDTDILTEDFCVQGEDKFIRCILPIPVIGSEQYFAFGVWGTLAGPNFNLMLETFNAQEQGNLEPMFSWLSNILPRDYYVPTKSEMEPQPNGKRPTLWLSDENHPYYPAQENGITFDQFLDIYAEYGNDIRPHLE